MAEADSPMPDDHSEHSPEVAFSSFQDESSSVNEKASGVEVPQTTTSEATKSLPEDNMEPPIVNDIEPAIGPTNEPEAETTTGPTTGPESEPTVERAADNSALESIGTIDLTLGDYDELPIVRGSLHRGPPLRPVKFEAVDEIEVASPLYQTPNTNATDNSFNDTALPELITDDVFMSSVEWNDRENSRVTDCHELFRETETEYADQGNPNLASLERNGFDSELEDEQKRAEFAAREKTYHKLKAEGHNQLADDIDFENERMQEKERVEARERRRSYRDVTEQEDSLFLPEGNPEHSLKPADHDAIFVDMVSDDEHDDEDILALSSHPQEQGSDKNAATKRNPKKRGRPKGSTTNKLLKRPRKTGTSKGTRLGTKQPPVNKSITAGLNALASLTTGDIAAQAGANQSMAALPQFPSRRQDALRKLISSMPVDQRSLHADDRKQILEAVKRFTPTAKIDALQTGYKIRGMITSLYPHQILGGAFMIRRERHAKPRGGMLSDEMGFGKTVMTIAAILDGKIETEHKRGPKATLIVAPSSLTMQWLAEITKHAGKSMGSVVVYRSGSKIISDDTGAMLSSMDVVITTYNAIMKSMPKNEAPQHLVTKEAKEAWWLNELATQKGILHRVKWHRIVLDEAQAIKNRSSRTFEAVMELDARYRWALTGTPVQNSLDEFFPYFAFLRMPDTGDFALWKRNFCKEGSDKAMRRLARMVNGMMLRRTHASHLFGAPCIKLPNISVSTVKVTFNEVERSIYQIVSTRFVAYINKLSQRNATERRYHFLLVLLLRLRQLASHILLIQQTLKDLLAPEDLERLWKVCHNAQAASKHDAGGREVIEGLEHALRNVKKSDASTSAGVTNYLQALRDDGKWSMIMGRSACAYCDKPPRDPQLTACFHIYCKECLEEMETDANIRQLPVGATCLECGVELGKKQPCSAFGEAAGGRSTPFSTQSTSNSRRGSGNSSDEEDIDWYNVDGPMVQSAKTRAATAQIAEWFCEDPTCKIIVFTQFRGIIKVLDRVCCEQRWECAHFHGAMCLDARESAIHQFTTQPQCKILLASMKAGGIGLNLTAANRCIIIDLWWNSSMEQQAFCRMFRIGQTRDVKVVRFAARNTIDDKIIQMQERKTAEIEPVIVQSKATSLNTVELLQLFGMDLERDDHGRVVGDGADEPFIFPQHTFDPADKNGAMEF